MRLLLIRFLVLINVFLLAAASSYSASAKGTVASNDIVPLSIPPHLCPDFAVCLSPFDYFRDDDRRIIHFAALSYRRFWHQTIWCRPDLCVAFLDDSLSDLAQNVRLHRLKNCPSPWRRHVHVTDVDNFIQEEIVKHTIASKHYNVSLECRDAVDSAASLYDLDCNTFIEVRVDSVVHSCELKRALCIAVDTLHLSVKDCFKPGIWTIFATQNEYFTVSY